MTRRLTQNWHYLLPALLVIAATVGVLVPRDAAKNPPARTSSAEELTAGGSITLCQALGPAAPHSIWAVDSAAGGGCGEVGWDSRQSQCVPWQAYAQGEYLGHARLPHVAEYRLRVDDQIAFYFLRTREVLDHPYQLQVGDRLRVESLTAGGSSAPTGDAEPATSDEDSLNREVIVQPDGTIALPLLGQIRAGWSFDTSAPRYSGRKVQAVLPAADYHSHSGANRYETRRLTQHSRLARRNFGWTSIARLRYSLGACQPASPWQCVRAGTYVA